MFALKEADLRDKRILDCPSGPDAFVAEAARRGLDVTGADPMYAQNVEAIVAAGMRDIDEGEQACANDPVMSQSVDTLAFHEQKRAALRAFAADFPEGKREGRYLAASLPQLPFEDKSFELTLSGNFLFAYTCNIYGGIAADGTFDLEFHLAALRELIRVTAGEIRLYPIQREDGSERINPIAAQAMGQLAKEGIDMRVESAHYVQSGLSGKLYLSIPLA